MYHDHIRDDSFKDDFPLKCYNNENTDRFHGTVIMQLASKRWCRFEPRFRHEFFVSSQIYVHLFKAIYVLIIVVAEAN